MTAAKVQLVFGRSPPDAAARGGHDGRANGEFWSPRRQRGPVSGDRLNIGSGWIGPGGSWRGCCRVSQR